MTLVIWANGNKCELLFYTSHWEMWEKNNSIYNSSKNINHLGINLVGNMQDPEENTSELLRAWKETMFSEGRLNTGTLSYV
jgi:hypothetical protein